MKPRHIPNILTCLRFLLVIPTLVALLNQHYLLAMCLFLWAAITDGVDGWLARVYGWTSRFGAIADPLADKVLLMSSFLAFAWLGNIPFWLAIVVVVRDIWIVAGATAYRYVIGPPALVPMGVSKINTFLQLLLVALLLIHFSLHIVPPILITLDIWAVLITSVISFVQYTWVWGWRAARHYEIKINNLRGSA